VALLELLRKPDTVGIGADMGRSGFEYVKTLLHGDQRAAQKKKRQKEKREKAVKHAKIRKRFGSTFYTSNAWLELRYDALKRNGGYCELCGRGKRDGASLHVDHIKPRSLHPELALVLENLQVLCEECNIGKGNRDDINWRDKRI